MFESHLYLIENDQTYKEHTVDPVDLYNDTGVQYWCSTLYIRISRYRGITSLNCDRKRFVVGTTTVDTNAFFSTLKDN